MKADGPFGLENASWPALLVDESGVIRAASQGASHAFGAIMSGESPFLASLWAAGNDSSVEHFLLRLDRSSGPPPYVRLKIRGGTSARFQCLAASFQRDAQRFFVLQFFREGIPAPTEHPADHSRPSPPSADRQEAADSPPARAHEAASAQKQKLDCALQLSRTVALDFNNALTSILGHTSLILGQMEADHPWRYSLMEVERSAEKAAEIAHDLAAFSRQEKDARAQTAGNLNALVRRVVNLFQRPDAAAVNWQLELEPRLFATEFDEAKLQQALLKVFENAFQAMENPGLIVVRSYNHPVAQLQHDESAELPPGTYVCVETIDTGCGIPLDLQPRIFEPFFTTKPNPPHRGLGLAWVYGIVTNHGGHVAVSSPPGQGTSVRIYLPAQARVVWDEPTPDDDLTGSARILMVDDEELLLTLGQTVLSAFGYEVWTASSGAQALQFFSQDPAQIDLVITDMVMPNMGGRELIDRLRTLAPGVRILCTSGYLRPAGYEGHELFLQKPFTTQALLRRVKQALTQSTPHA
jgi:signal transduction histidine kinase